MTQIVSGSNIQAPDVVNIVAGMQDTGTRSVISCDQACLNTATCQSNYRTTDGRCFLFTRTLQNSEILSGQAGRTADKEDTTEPCKNYSAAREKSDGRKKSHIRVLVVVMAEPPHKKRPVCHCVRHEVIVYVM